MRQSLWTVMRCGLVGLCLARASVALAVEPGAASTSFGAFLGAPTQVNHSLDYESSPDAVRIETGLKSYWTSSGARIDDVVFRDALGREAYFRGWNVSGSTKLVETGFKPFRSVADAQTSLTRMADRAAPNLIRYLIAWEGTNPAPETIDKAYLDQVAEQMKVAISKRIYVLLDYHQDLFSRHLFNKDSWHTGNGAPAWVTPKSDYPAEYCGPICTGWPQHNVSDEAVRRAARNFWNNKSFVAAANGKTYKMQEVFLWQLRESLAYLRTKFSDKEFDYVLGVDPFNEPIDGGMEGLTPRQWENTKLWPFHEEARKILNATGWAAKSVYAEPLVFWNTNVGITPATGGQLLDKKPGPGFVFNTHFYDASRQALNTALAINGTYFPNFDEIRKEGRYRGNPILLSEFGAGLGKIGREDPVRILQSMYQGMEASDAINGKTRYVDFYANPISGTQWHWDYYYDKHNELMNGNPSKLLTGTDAWNGENYSVAQHDAMDFTLSQEVVARAYPRRVQGDLMHFYFNNLARDAWDKPLDWAAIRPDRGGPMWLKDTQFILTTWRGRRSNASTEIALPSYWDAAKLVVMTDKKLYAQGSLVKDAALVQTMNEAALASDSISKTATRLLVWDDPDGDETAESIHFALVIRPQNPGVPVLTPSQLEALQRDLIQALCQDKRGVVFLTGDMAPGGYPAE